MEMLSILAIFYRVSNALLTSSGLILPVKGLNYESSGYESITPK